jgi:putative protein kinase ArgK-like GTPase of G3E family
MTVQVDLLGIRAQWRTFADDNSLGILVPLARIGDQLQGIITGVLALFDIVGVNMTTASTQPRHGLVRVAASGLCGTDHEQYTSPMWRR